MVEDLQERLDEAKAEIAAKRKDEKDLKSKDRAQTIQIAGVSGIVLQPEHLGRLSVDRIVRGGYFESTEKSRSCKGESRQHEQDVQFTMRYVAWSGHYSIPFADSIDEAQRLRDLLRDRDEEIERLEDASIMHEGEESKVCYSFEIQQIPKLNGSTHER